MILRLAEHCNHLTKFAVILTYVPPSKDSCKSSFKHDIDHVSRLSGRWNLKAAKQTTDPRVKTVVD